MDASFDTRVERRYKDLINLNIKNVSIEEVANDLKTGIPLILPEGMPRLKKQMTLFYRYDIYEH